MLQAWLRFRNVPTVLKESDAPASTLSKRDAFELLNFLLPTLGQIRPDRSVELGDTRRNADQRLAIQLVGGHVVSHPRSTLVNRQDRWWKMHYPEDQDRDSHSFWAHRRRTAGQHTTPAHL